MCGDWGLELSHSDVSLDFFDFSDVLDVLFLGGVLKSIYERGRGRTGREEG